MKTSVRIGYDLFVGYLSGAELEVLNRIQHKLVKLDDRYMGQDTVNPAGEKHPAAGKYVFVTLEDTVHPAFEITLVEPGKITFTQEEFQACQPREE